MTRRRIAQCCCEANPSLQNCNTWQSLCFGTADPYQMPVSCSFTATTTVNIEELYCCAEGGPSYIKSTVYYSATVTAVGTREVSSTGGPCGFASWTDQNGIRYRLTGTISSTFRQSDYDLVIDDFGNCAGSSLCRTTELTAHGAIAGCAYCNTCRYPQPAPVGCNCGFSCAGRRGWGVSMSGTVQASGSLAYFGQCCAAREKIGEPCTETLAPYDVTATCEAQFRAACAPVSSGCQRPAEGGCADWQWGGISCAGGGAIGNYSSSTPCFGSETQSGTATLII